MNELCQIERIKKKLIIAKKTDKDLKVFGADEHEYNVGHTVNESQIVEFENEYELKLPECYRAFLLNIGNGGKGYLKSAAGPFYGIYPLGENVDDFIYENARLYLKQNCRIYPDMDAEYWSELIKEIEKDDISDEVYEKELGKIYAGLLPIGSQGCTYHHAIVLNGQFKGKVVNIDSDFQKPKFTFESSFLDWYERWLDEVISGDLLDSPSWFGYGMGGTTKDLLQTYFSTTEFKIKIDCLSAILKKASLDIGSLNFIEEEYQLSSGELREIQLQVLVKFDYDRAFNHLVAYKDENLLAVFQFVFWYAKDKSADWLGIIESSIEKINNEETFTFCTYLLEEIDVNYAYLIVPFTSHENENIRVSAFYVLGQLKNKSEYVETFIRGLNDEVGVVIHASLQALNGVRDKRLLRSYKGIAERFKKEQNYILANLNHNLKEYGLSTTTIKSIDIDVFEIERL